MTKLITAELSDAPGEHSHASAAPKLVTPTLSSKVFMTLLPLTLTVFIAFLIIGLQLPVLPLHIHDALGMGALVVGAVVGVQFVAALLSRSWAGNLADIKGTKFALILGLIMASLSGLAYLFSLAFVTKPELSVIILVAGRIILALGESLIITGALGWGLGLAGVQNAGKVMAWNGIAMYAAFSLGAPLGVAVNTKWGFASIAIAAIIIPILAGVVAINVRSLAPTATRRTPFYKVLSAVWLPGTGLALASIGFGAVTTFIALLFAAKDWGNSSLAFTAFGIAFISARVFFGHLPDQLGGARVAMVCVLIEALGQFLIWGADDATMAYAGAALTGFGYSLAFPGFGVEAVRRVSPQTRSLAMGAYVAFLDISLGITSPLAGILAGQWGIESVYLVGGLAVASSVVIALTLVNKKASASI